MNHSNSQFLLQEAEFAAKRIQEKKAAFTNIRFKDRNKHRSSPNEQEQFYAREREKAYLGVCIKEMISKDVKTEDQLHDGSKKSYKDTSKNQRSLANSTLVELKKIKQKDLLDIIEQITNHSTIQRINAFKDSRFSQYKVPTKQ